MKRFLLLTGLLTAALCNLNGQGTVQSANSATSLITNILTGAPVVVGTSIQGFCLGWCDRCFIPEPSVLTLARLGAVMWFLGRRRT